MRNVAVSLLLTAGLLAGGMSCSWSRTKKGAAIGTVGGGLLGEVIGRRAGNTALGTILGAAVGGAAGAYIGHYMDGQADDMRKDLEGAKIERIGEGIRVTFDSGILFDVDKADLRAEAVASLQKLANILIKYPDTNIQLEGHADASGTDEYNLDLSKRRAQSVADCLAGFKADPARFTVSGYGEAQPIASNDTPEGRQANRRVELVITANEQLKELAKSQKG